MLYEVITAYRNMSRNYLVTLAADTPNPFAPENDEVEIAAEEKADAKPVKGKGDKNEKSEEPSVKETKIDLEGIQDRVISLPVRRNNFV